MELQIESGEMKLSFWFFQFWFCQVYDSTYDSDFQFALVHKCSYDSDYDSVASENQPLKCVEWTENHL